MNHGQYIATLAASAGVLLTNEQVEALVKLDNKVDINKAFFALAAKPVEQVRLDMSGMQKGLEESMLSVKKREVEDQTYVMKDHMARALRHFQDGHAQLRLASDIRLELANLGGMVLPKFEDLIEKVYADPFWSVSHVDKQYYKVKFTSKHAVCRYVNKTQGVDMTVNFGVFQVEWRILTNDIKVLPISDNLEVDGHHHPHISYGVVCWGNAKDTVVNALMAFDIASVLKVVQSILTTYNPDSPYVEMSRFWVQQNPAALEGAAVTYEFEGKAWIRDYVRDEIYVNVLDEEAYGGDEDETIYKIRVYRKEYAGYGIRADEKDYYQCSDTGEYLELEEVHEWA